MPPIWNRRASLSRIPRRRPRSSRGSRPQASVEGLGCCCLFRRSVAMRFSSVLAGTPSERMQLEAAIMAHTDAAIDLQVAFLSRLDTPAVRALGYIGADPRIGGRVRSLLSHAPIGSLLKSPGPFARFPTSRPLFQDGSGLRRRIKWVTIQLSVSADRGVESPAIVRRSLSGSVFGSCDRLCARQRVRARPSLRGRRYSMCAPPVHWR
jgi:hypothetical protein